MPSSAAPLSRTDASKPVESIGWRYLLGVLHTSVAVTSLAQATEVARAAVEACGVDADEHLRADLRPDRVELSVQTKGTVTGRDVGLAKAVSAALAAAGHKTAGATSADRMRPVQALEFAIDTTDYNAIRPFWKAVLAYADDPIGSSALVDPAGQQPTLWFQEMDPPRLDRNRIHLDVTVAHDEAEPRVQAALAAGGVLVSDAEARSFWILADADGNEACVCTWLDRDQYDEP